MNRIQILAVPALLLAGHANAETVYSQPGTTSCFPQCSSSHYRDNLSFGIRTYDNFKLDTAANITTVSWQGVYFGLFQKMTDPPPLPSTTSWQLEFFANADNSPGASLYATTMPVANVTRTLLGTGLGPVGTGAFNVNFYEFTATLPTSFQASADTDYWFSPLSFAPEFTTFFMWTPSTLTFDGTSWRNGTGLPSGESVPVDFAFALGAASAVPEPDSWALLIAGFGAVGLAARRRRSLAA